MKEINEHNRRLQKLVGLVSALLTAGLLSSATGWPGSLPPPDWPQARFLLAAYGAIAALFAASAFAGALGPAQPALYLGLSSLETAQGADSLDGLAFALVAAMLFLRRGWFYRMPLLKAGIVGAAGTATLAGPVLLRGGARPVPSIVALAVFFLVVAGFAHGRFLEAFAPKKRVLRLADYDLSARETQVVRMRILGKSAKEIACDCDIAVSTVRNKLSSAYRKLGLEGSEGLAALAERCKIQ